MNVPGMVHGRGGVTLEENVLEQNGATWREGRQRRLTPHMLFTFMGSSRRRGRDVAVLWHRTECFGAVHNYSPGHLESDSGALVGCEQRQGALGVCAHLVGCELLMRKIHHHVGESTTTAHAYHPAAR